MPARALTTTIEGGSLRGRVCCVGCRGLLLGRLVAMGLPLLVLLPPLLLLVKKKKKGMKPAWEKQPAPVRTQGARCAA